jgi:hypothetical protein
VLARKVKSSEDDLEGLDTRASTVSRDPRPGFAARPRTGAARRDPASRRVKVVYDAAPSTDEAHRRRGARVRARPGGLRMIRWTRLAWLTLALSGACGDRRDVDHAFRLGPPYAPGVPESLAAMTATWVLSDAVTFAGTTDPTVVSDVAGTVSQLPDALLGELSAVGAPAEALAAALGVALDEPVRAGRFAVSAATADAGASRSLPPFDPACLDPGPTSLAYSGCRTSMPVEGGDSVVTLDGSVQRTAEGIVTWALVETVTVTTGASQGKRVVELSGTITVADGAISGQARSDAHTVETDPLRVMTTGSVTFVDVDVGAEASPFCIAGGAIELRRIWTERAFEQPSVWPHADGAIRFSWSGCGAFVVARSF